MSIARSWRLGLLALYLGATLVAALLPEVRAVFAASPDAASHGAIMTAAITMDCDHAGATAERDHHQAPCGPTDRQAPETCGAGSLCALAHLWLPPSLSSALATPLPDVVMPVAVPPLVGIERAPDLRPPSFSA